MAAPRSMSVAILRTRPPCPPMPSPHRLGLDAWHAERAVWAWRLQHETHAEYVARRRQENASLRKRPRKRRRTPDAEASVRRYTRRLAGLPASAFDDLRDARVVLSAYHVPERLSTDPTATPQRFPMHLLVLWTELVRRNVRPVGIVPHTGTWVTVHGKKRRQFKVATPAGCRRVFIGDTVKMLGNVAHPLSYGKTDHVFAETAPCGHEATVDVDEIGRAHV